MATSPHAPKILSSGCEVVAINAKSDPTFPGHLPDPILPQNLKELQSTESKKTQTWVSPMIEMVTESEWLTMKEKSSGKIS